MRRKEKIYGKENNPVASMLIREVGVICGYRSL
jgi:hypothetical protein